MMRQSLGQCYLSQGLRLSQGRRLSEALIYLKQAAALQADQTTAYNAAGLCAYRLGEINEARALWQESLQIDESTKNRAHGYMKVFDTEEFRYFMQSFNQALSSMNKQQYRAARVCLLQHHMKKMHNAASLNLLGLARYKEGKHKEALRAWQQSLAIDISHPKTTYYMTLVQLPKSLWKRWSDEKLL